MGRWKRFGEELDARRAWAAEILQEHGALKPCDVHEDYLIDQLDPGAEAEAIEAAKAKLPEWLAENEAEDFFRDVMTDYGDECPGCPDADD